jgi:hypothetical protein
MKKDIKNYKGLYQVDEKGNVYSLPRKYIRTSRLRSGKVKDVEISVKGKILKNYKAKNGYYVVNLCGVDGHKQRYVHDLVARAFLGEKPKRHTVNHIDGIKTNNNLQNLEYVTYSENNKHARDNGLNNVNIGDYAVKHAVNQICAQTGTIINTFESCVAAERELNISHVCCAAKGNRKTAGKYKWEYINN